MTFSVFGGNGRSLVVVLKCRRIPLIFHCLQSTCCTRFGLAQRRRVQFASKGHWLTFVDTIFLKKSGKQRPEPYECLDWPLTIHHLVALDTYFS